MDFLDSFEQKYIPNIHSYRYQQRRKRVLELKQTCQKNPQKLGLQDLKTVLRVLKYYHLLPENNIEHQKLQFKFNTQIAKNFFYSSLIGFSPYFLRQFHNWRSLKKLTLVSGLFLSSYMVLMYPVTCQLNQFNRKLVQNNIHKFSIDIEQKKKKAFQQSKSQ